MDLIKDKVARREISNLMHDVQRLYGMFEVGNPSVVNRVTMEDVMRELKGLNQNIEMILRYLDVDIKIQEFKLSLVKRETKTKKKKA